MPTTHIIKPAVPSADQTTAGEVGTALPQTPPAPPQAPSAQAPSAQNGVPQEIGGPSGPEPTRFGDWEHKGRCSDF